MTGLVNLLASLLLLASVSGGKTFYEITKEDVFSHPDVTGSKISFFGVVVGDSLEKAKKFIPGFKSVIETSRKAVFDDAWVEYDESGKVTSIAIGKSYVSRMRGKTRRLFDADIFTNADKRYDILNPRREKATGREVTLDKIKIEEYRFLYPDRGILLLGRKSGDNIVLNYLVLQQEEKE